MLRRHLASRQYRPGVYRCGKGMIHLTGIGLCSTLVVAT